MLGFWTGEQDAESQVQANLDARLKAQSLERTVSDLGHEVRRLALLNQALWELLREKLQVDDAMLEEKVQAIDLRDGVKDGEITNIPLECPKCGRISNSRHCKCLYCGLEFKNPSAE